MKHHPNSPAAMLSGPLSAALAAGITFNPVQGAPPGHLDVEVCQALANKATAYRLRLGTALYYPTAGKQPTKAQSALIDPVLRTVAIYSVPADELAALADPLNIPPPEEPKRPRHEKQKGGGWGLIAAGYAFAPVYAIGSLLFKTAAKYK